MDVARLNFSHGTQADHARMIEMLREVSGALGQPLAILQDLQGPKIRTDTVRGGQIDLRDGAEVTLTTEEVEGTPERISTSYEHLARDVRAGDTILLDDGLIELEVIATDGREARCRVRHGGPLRDHKGINLPGVAISAPSVTEKDREDLRFGLAQGVDFVAISFVRHPDDVREVQRLIRAAGADVPVIAKLEKPEAMAHLGEILEVTDGVMIARGDLGVEMPLEQVPPLQKRIIRQCNERGVVVITATQMLESMCVHPRPTRAEASDVANAVFDGTDAVMLSAETSVGQYPVEAVATMARIVAEAETTHTLATRSELPPLRGVPPVPNAVTNAACEAAQELNARALIAFTHSGFTARLISKYHPSVPVLAFTPFPHVQRRLSLYWGLTPRLMAPVSSTDEMIAQVERELLAEGFVQTGDLLVIVAGMPPGSPTNMMKVQRVGEKIERRKNSPWRKSRR